MEKRYVTARPSGGCSFLMPPDTRKRTTCFRQWSTLTLTVQQGPRDRVVILAMMLRRTYRHV
jgi:hypothetical protein